jgi:DNA-directed RNA polymerase sigma subunit (sigma70/sigma32)
MPAVNPETLRLLNAINGWLSDVFGDGARLSDLLYKAGLSETEIEQIKTDYLTIYIQSVLNLIAATTDKHDGERRNAVMMRYYGLMNGERESLQAIGESLQLSRERMRQLLKKRLQLYRHPKRKEKFLAELGKLAREMLNR